MPLAQVLILEVAVLGGGALLLRQGAPTTLASTDRRTWILDRVALIAVVSLVALIAMRSTAFGTDTAYYLDAFRTFCAPRPSNSAEGEFLVSSLLLNVAMLGACDTRLLPMAWAIIVGGVPLLAYGALALRVRFIALLLMSFVGIELLTNTLRQGFAVGLLVVAVSQYRRRRWLSVGAWALAIALHSSSALVLACLLLAALPWRWFLGAILAVAVLVAGVATRVVDVDVQLPVRLDILYVLGKYAEVQADESLVRVLAAGNLAAVFAGAYFSATTAGVGAWLRSPGNRLPLRLAVTAIPFLPVPYFGYRLLYGIAPLVTWILGAAAHEDSAEVENSFFVWTLAFNVIVLLAWSVGSSVIRSTPFIG